MAYRILSEKDFSGEERPARSGRPNWVGMCLIVSSDEPLMCYEVFRENKVSASSVILMADEPAIATAWAVLTASRTLHCPGIWTLAGGASGLITLSGSRMRSTLR